MQKYFTIKELKYLFYIMTNLNYSANTIFSITKFQPVTHAHLQSLIKNKHLKQH